MTTALIDADKYKASGGVYEHRSIASAALGRPLAGKECVHHVDYDKRNNSNENLVICPDSAYHKLLHVRQRILDLGGHPDTHKYCDYHKRLEKRSEFSTRPSGYDGLHNRCRVGTNEARRGIGYSKWSWKRSLQQQTRRAIKRGVASWVL